MARQSHGKLAARVRALIEGGGGESFDELALELFRDHCTRLSGYAELCRRHGCEPESVDDWRQVPALPRGAYEPEAGKSAADAALASLEEAVVDATLGALAGRERPAILALSAAAAESDDRRRPGRVDHLLRAWGGDGSGRAYDARGVDFKAARSWLAARQRQGGPAVVIAGPAAVERLSSALERLDLRFRLAPQSRLIVLAEPAAATVATSAARLGERLALPPTRVLLEYAPAGVVTCFYAAGHGEPRFTAPPWTRVRSVDPATGKETAAGGPGRLAIFDLARLHAPAHTLTVEHGSTDADAGFRLVDRAGAAGRS